MAISAKNNFTWLLAGIMILLLATPLVRYSSSGLGPWVLMAAFTATQVLGVWSLVATRKWFIFGVVLMVLGVVLHAGYLMTSAPVLSIAFLIVFGLFCLLTITFAMRDIILSRVIESNKLMGAISVYLLLGVIWAVAYILLELIAPGAFKGLSNDVNYHSDDLIYFSFVTLTTLGYGDITPINSIVRTLVYLEAVVGQLFVSVMIAGLVGIHFTSIQNKER